jgi:hypothetical protein
VVGVDAKELNQWWLEWRPKKLISGGWREWTPMKLTKSNQGGEEAKEVNQRQLGDEPKE